MRHHNTSYLKTNKEWRYLTRSNNRGIGYALGITRGHEMACPDLDQTQKLWSAISLPQLCTIAMITVLCLAERINWVWRWHWPINNNMHKCFLNELLLYTGMQFPRYEYQQEGDIIKYFLGQKSKCGQLWCKKEQSYCPMTKTDTRMSNLWQFVILLTNSLGNTVKPWPNNLMWNLYTQMA